MLNFLKSLFARSVDSIVADIVQKIEHLSIVAEAHAVEQAAQQKIIDEATKAKAFAETEITRAKAIAAKLSALVA